MWNNIKRHLISIAVTFVSTFALTVLLAIQADIDFDYFNQGAYIAVIVAGARAAIKVTIEVLIAILQKK